MSTEAIAERHTPTDAFARAATRKVISAAQAAKPPLDEQPAGYWRVVVRDHSGRSVDYKDAKLGEAPDLTAALKKLLGKPLVITHAFDDVEVIHPDAVASIRATWVRKERS